MGEQKIENQVREQYVEAMGSDLGAIFYELYIAISMVHVRWTLYRQLFADPPSRVDTLNASAPQFFGILQLVLYEDVVLQLARLTDPPKSGRKNNLTIKRLSELLPDDEFKVELTTLVERACAACETARDWRNRRIAHNDLELALATSTDPLPGISRATIEAALSAIRDLMNKLEVKYRDAVTAYELTIMAPGDGDALIYYLEKGVAADRIARGRSSVRG